MTSNSNKTFLIAKRGGSGSIENDIKRFRLSVNQCLTHETDQVKITPDITNFKIAVSHNEKFIFAVNNSANIDQSRIYAWRIKDAQDLETPTFLGSWPIGGTQACHVAIDSRDRFVYVANYGGSVSVFKAIGSSGELVRCNLFKFGCVERKLNVDDGADDEEEMENQELDSQKLVLDDQNSKKLDEQQIQQLDDQWGMLVSHQTQKLNDRGSECMNQKEDERSGTQANRDKRQSHVTAIILSPDDDYVYASDAGNDCIWKFYYSRLSGLDFITELPKPNWAPMGSGPGRGVIAKRSAGSFLYIGCSNNYLLIYFVDPDECGMLEQVQYIPLMENPRKEENTGITDIQMSIDSKLIYSVSKNVISVLDIADDGTATLIQCIQSTISHPNRLFLIANQNLLLAVNEGSEELMMFDFNNDSRKLMRNVTAENLILKVSPVSLTV